MKNFIRLITEDEKWSKVWFGLFLLMGTISGIVVGVIFWDDKLSFIQNILPIVTTPIGFSCVYLLGVGKNSGNTMGFISNILEGVVNFMYGNFGLFIGVIYYGATHIIGYFDWKKNEKSDGRVVVKDVNSKRDVVVMVSAILFSTFVTWLMYRGDAITFELLSFEMIANIAVMYLGILAQGLMILRYKFAWVVWVLLNIVAIPLNFATGNAVFAVMYIFYMINALISLYYQYFVKVEVE